MLCIKIFLFYTISQLNYYYGTAEKCEVKGNILECSQQKLTSTVVSLDDNVAKELESVNFSQNDITDVNLESFSNVVYANLYCNNIREVKIYTFSSLTKIKSINLSHNKIESLHPDIFMNNRELKTLIMDSNPLRLLAEGPIFNSESMESLYLASCSLQTLKEQHFSGLPSLRTLDISSNSLQTLSPTTFSNLEKLTEINLFNNLFHCDCSLEILIEWTSQKESDMSQNSIYCTSLENTTPSHVKWADIKPKFKCDVIREKFISDEDLSSYSFRSFISRNASKILLIVSLKLLLLAVCVACLIHRKRNVPRVIIFSDDDHNIIIDNDHLNDNVTEPLNYPYKNIK